MNAPADYKEAVANFSRALPPYVTYTQHLHGKFDAFARDEDNTITVRTKDGKVVRGQSATISFSGEKERGQSIVTHSPFRPACYDPRSARLQQFEGRQVEAISLAGHCKENDDDKKSHNGDFNVLYVDPGDHTPIAVEGTVTDSGVYLHLLERYTRQDGHVLPSALTVRVKGSGWMFWLDVDARVEITNYHFSDKFP